MSSLFRRAVRLAQSNLNELKDRATTIGRSDQSLEDMSDAELEAELDRRRKDHSTRAAVEEAKRRAGEDEPDERERPTDRGRRSKKTSSASVLDLFELPPNKRRQVRQYYANLELPFGADLDEVKQAYRRLMRQYHPDKHQSDPARRQLATQLSQKLTVAYNELSKLLRDKKK
jgi:DnaJ-domain-containing protein 1